MVSRVTVGAAQRRTTVKELFLCEVEAQAASFINFNSVNMPTPEKNLQIGGGVALQPSTTTAACYRLDLAVPSPRLRRYFCVGAHC